MSREPTPWGPAERRLDHFILPGGGQGKSKLSPDFWIEHDRRRRAAADLLHGQAERLRGKVRASLQLAALAFVLLFVGYW